MPFNYCGTKRPHEALLNLYIDKNMMIVERRREPQGANGTPPFVIFESNSVSGTFRRTVYGGQFAWGRHLQKSNAGTQRSTWSG